jgi:dolichol-phosphate mannosyltransferase
VGVKVKDATSGFKAFRSSTLRSLDLAALKSKGYAFQAELILVCERAGFDITEHPYRFTERASGQSKMSAGIVYEAVVTLLPLRFRRG